MVFGMHMGCIQTVKDFSNLEVFPTARSWKIEMIVFAMQHGENILQWRWLSIKYSGKWQPLKAILIRLRTAKRYGLLRWDCLCHSPMSFHFLIKQQAICFAARALTSLSTNLSMCLSNADQMGFEMWCSVGSVHCFLLSNLSSGCITPQ